MFNENLFDDCFEENLNGVFNGNMFEILNDIFDYSKLFPNIPEVNIIENVSSNENTYNLNNLLKDFYYFLFQNFYI